VYPSFLHRSSVQISSILLAPQNAVPSPYIVLQDMPFGRRHAKGYAKEVDSELFSRKMQRAEDTGLWEGNCKKLTGRHLFLNLCSCVF